MKPINSMKNLFPKSMSKGKWFTTLLTVVVLTVVAGTLIYEGSKRTVSVSLDGEEQLVRTHASTVEDIINELELEVHPQDYLSPKASASVYHDMKIKWEPAKQVSLVVDKEETTVMTTAKTVGELLRREKMEVGDNDQLSHSPQDKIETGMEISLDQAFTWTLVDGTTEQKMASTSITVADFLEQQAIQLNKEDRIEPGLDTYLEKGTRVQITRVEKVTDVVEEPTDFTVETRQDADLAEGTEEVTQEGEKGLIEKTFEIVKENGKEVSREMISEKVVKESQTQVVSVGTKQAVAEVTPEVTEEPEIEATHVSNPAPSEQQAAEPEPVASNEITVSSTAYTAHCNGCTGVTATGLNLKDNPDMKVIAVDPSVIPLGSKVYVEGYGYAIAGDTGGAIKGNKIDVFMPSKEAAYGWGNRQVTIKVLP